MRPQEQASDPSDRKLTSRRETQKKSDHDGTRAYSILTRSTTGTFPRNLETRIIQIDYLPLTSSNDDRPNLALRCRRGVVISNLRDSLPYFNYLGDSTWSACTIAPLR